MAPSIAEKRLRRAFKEYGVEIISARKK